MNMRDSDGWRLFLSSREFDRLWQVYLIRDVGNGRNIVLQRDGSTVTKEANFAYDDISPTFLLTAEQIQAVTDGLAEKGFVPKERRYEAEMGLMKNHLNDMRRLVFQNVKEAPVEP